MGKEVFSVALMGECRRFARQIHLAEIAEVRVYMLSSLEHFGLEAGFDMLVMDVSYFSDLPAALLMQKAAAGYITPENLVVVRGEDVLYGIAAGAMSRRLMALLFKSLGHLPLEPTSARIQPWLRFFNDPGVMECSRWCKVPPAASKHGELWEMAKEMKSCWVTLKATEVALKTLIAEKKAAGLSLSELSRDLLDTVSSLLMVCDLLAVPGIRFSVEEEREYMLLIQEAVRKLARQLVMARFRYTPDEVFQWYFGAREEQIADLRLAGESIREQRFR